MEHGGDPRLEGGLGQGPVLRGEQRPVGGELEGEGGELGQIGEGGGEQRPVDGGVGVGVDGEGPLGLPLIADDQGLTGKDPVQPPQAWVVAQQLVRADLIAPGHRPQGVPLLHHVGEGGIPHQDDLPHHQLGGVGQLVVLE